MSGKLTKSFSVREWTDIRERLKNKSLTNEDWHFAIQLLTERIEERYFQPINILISKVSNHGAGFTILTIECALIEFFATLEDGLLFKWKKESTDLSCYYQKSSKIYQRFLHTAPILDGFFNCKIDGKHLFTPYDFYHNVRCPLIHEAQTKNGWEVRIFGKTLDNDLTNRIPFEIEKDGTKVIYRTALFYTLEEYFNFYTNSVLKQQNENGRTKRKFLARKIDHIAEIQPDDKWWWKK